MRLVFLCLVTLVIESVSAADAGWPFDQAHNVAVITQKQIMSGKVPILVVTHDRNDHGWQFLNPTIPTSYENASVVGLAT